MTAQLEHRTARPDLPAISTVRLGPVRINRVAQTAGMIWRLAPYTVAIVATMLVGGLVTGTLWHEATQQSWFGDVAYGLPSLTDGRWWTPITGAFLALNPWYYLPMAGGFALLVGYAETQLGTRRTVLVTVGAHFFAIVVAAVFLLAFRGSGWPWAESLSGRHDVGFSAGSLAALAVTSAGMRSPWRLRVRALLCIYVLLSFVLIGSLADLLHLIAVGAGLPMGRRLIHRDARALPHRPSRREWRLLAVAGLVLIAVSDVILWLGPTDGPFGATGSEDLTLLNIGINLTVTVALSNGLRNGRRRAWWVAVVLAGGHTLAGLLLPGGALLALLAGTEFDADGIGMFIANQIAWTAVFLVLVIGRREFRAPSPRRVRGNLAGRANRALATEILRRHGGSTLSWMTTWPGNRYFTTGNGNSVVAYQVHAGVAISVGDPVGPAAARPCAIAEFARDSEQSGLVPAFFSVTAATTAKAAADGWRHLQIAEDTILDLPGLEFRGKSWQDVRTALNRAAKEHIGFRLTRLADEPAAVVAQLRAISAEWVGDKGLPELGFTLGGVDQALDPAVRVGLAEDETGHIHGVVSWLPVHTGDGRIDGWTLDIMRRRDGGFRPVIEYLIAQSCLAFQAEGARFASLSGAPLARTSANGDFKGLPRILDGLGSVMEPVYGFRSLHAFKSKFQPRYESMHLIYRDEADLPRIGLALARAYLPATPVREMVRAARAGH